MRLGIVGNGIVGCATAKGLGWKPCTGCGGSGYVDVSREPCSTDICDCAECDGAKVVSTEHSFFAWDTDPSRCSSYLPTVLHCDLVFICLPTPQKPNSLACDTSVIDEFLCAIDDLDTNIVLRSTVPIGYTSNARHRYGLINLIHWPDFHTERLDDADKPTRLVVGYPPGRNRCAEMLTMLFRQRWPKAPFFQLSTDESEAVKLIQNAFSAVKIAFFNEVYELMTPAILNALLAGGWINPMHTQVPGPDGRFGFGGSCLPKDLANLIHCLGIDAMVCAAALSRNTVDRG